MVNVQAKEKIQETFQIYFMVRLRDFSLDEKELKFQPWFLGWSKILSGKSKNISNGSIFYILANW